MPQAVDPANQVQGAVGVYDCPDLASVDKCIRQIMVTRTKIVESGKYPELPSKYDADIDLLLERRRWLEILLEEAPC